MAAPHNFRSAFNGFNREDVVRYLEYINGKHASQINQLTSEAEYLRSRLESMADVTALEQERDELRAQLEALQARCDELESRCAQEEVQEDYSPARELETYRRAERTERMARERAELVYHQTNSVLAETLFRVDALTNEVGPKAEQAMEQLEQLRALVEAGKAALQEAVSVMSALRPNNE